jgi:2-phosphosulfolactate phosphatase
MSARSELLTNDPIGFQQRELLMKFERATLATCHLATDLVVAIDVLRAFTTAGFLFQAGVLEIILVSGVQEAFRLRDEMPDCLLMGEVDGVQVPGFDLPNSPSRIHGLDLAGRRVIQRTSAGTQGVILAQAARTILAASLTNLSATCRCIRAFAPEVVNLVQTGLLPEEGWGDEDVACAECIEAVFSGQAIDWGAVTQRVRRSCSGSYFDGAHKDFPPADLGLALEVDLFSFAMLVERQNSLHLIRPFRID